MRQMTVLVGALMLALLTNARTGVTQEFRHYPWCLFSGGSDAGIETCAFDSFEQCLLTRSGGGGICYANPAYSAVREPPAVVAEPPRQTPPRPANQRKRG